MTIFRSRLLPTSKIFMSTTLCGIIGNVSKYLLIFSAIQLIELIIQFNAWIARHLCKQQYGASSMQWQSAVKCEPFSKMLKLFLLSTLLLSEPTYQIVTLRTRNERGPSAWTAGIKCLEALEKSFDGLTVALQEGDYYRGSRAVNRTTNVIMVHLHNLSSPAAEIETNYLKQLNLLIANGDIQR